MEMKDLDDHDRSCEEVFGLISGAMLYGLHLLSTAAGSSWDLKEPSTMEIVVTRENAAAIYDYCKEIRSGYSIGLNPSGMKKVRKARVEAHQYLFEEANNPNTPIQRKIELVRLTSKG